MIDVDSVMYRAKINGYHYFYESGFISVFDEDVTLNKSAQCLFRTKANCSSQKDFELETIYVNSKINNVEFTGG
jgi:hypothetical protein